MRDFADLDELTAAKGEHLGHGDWLEVTQDRIDQFADATGDHQWIHVDADRAKDGPFGTTIAHGYLTLSLIPMLGKQIYRVGGIKMGINYGLDKVRFPSVVHVGARVRTGIELVEVTDRQEGKLVMVRHTVEIEDSEKPACVADSLVLYVR
ncbi:MAG: hypothetical protein GEV28_23695 [Actinophytocola sp.]|uniref:MaoC family dehydratase n=1 Tax=Actinophytocola sp. TaxID=1872138 RepID=UPI001328512D|nr:MaoC family dehydratase [Actinophytocola sp.]MPZ83231.1 hypothetical protein [Actinophytocola sp.]